MNKHHNLTFYVCFCFIILFTSSYKAQQKQINIFFNKEKKMYYTQCLDNDDYKTFKKNNMSEAIALLEESCKAINNDYDHFSENTIRFLDSLDSKNNKQDFIILNKALRSLYYSSPVVTVLKVRDSNTYPVIHNYISYDDAKREFIVLTDHALGGFNADKILKLFEDYLYKGKKSSISENINNFPKSSAGLKFCYIISRIKGKFSIKKYYYLDNENYD